MRALTPVAVVLGRMLTSLEGLVGEFGSPINAEINRLIKLTKALRDRDCGGSGPQGLEVRR